MTALQPAQSRVDEMFPNRHRSCGAPVVESPSRAAGGIPTLGGGVRTHSRPDMTRRADPARPGVGGAGEGGH